MKPPRMRPAQLFSVVVGTPVFLLGYALGEPVLSALDPYFRALVWLERRFP